MSLLQTKNRDMDKCDDCVTQLKKNLNIVVTDVTSNKMTITVREFQMDEGSFKSHPVQVSRVQQDLVSALQPHVPSDRQEEEASEEKQIIGHYNGEPEEAVSLTGSNCMTSRQTDHSITAAQIVDQDSSPDDAMDMNGSDFLPQHRN